MADHQGIEAVVAGLGCSSRCDAAEVTALVRRALALAAIPPAALRALAAPAARCRAVPALAAAAQGLGVPLIPVSRDRLAAVQDRIVTLSARALRETGLAGLAEAAALAAGGGVLLRPRIASAHVTCALADLPGKAVP